MTKEKKENLEEIEAEIVDDPIEESPQDESASESVQETEEISRLKETIARLQADFINYKNRSEKEKSIIYSYASEGIITKLLTVVDNFERALNTVTQEDSFTEGMRLIQEDLLKTLKSEGLEEVKSDGEKFDPTLHHAVFMEDSEDVESEHIIETFQKGYKLKDKVIRPAMVKVAK